VFLKVGKCKHIKTKEGPNYARAWNLFTSGEIITFQITVLGGSM
jgi:hypothetical protein